MAATETAGNSLVRRVILAYQQFARGSDSLQTAFLLGIRLYWGWQFAVTGWGKIQHPEKVAGFFTTLGIPFPALNAFGVSWAEFIGGVCLMLGLGSRFWGFLLAADMVVAYLTDGREQLHAFFSDPAKFYGYDAFTYLFAAAIIFIFGPGRIALDELIRRHFAPPRP